MTIVKQIAGTAGFCLFMSGVYGAVQLLEIMVR